MSNLYSKLAGKESQFDNASGAGQSFSPKKSSLLVFFVFIAFLFSLAALAGAGFLYQSLNAERREREALESSQLQISEKSKSLENVTDVYKNQLQELQDKLQNYEQEREEFKNAIEDNRKLVDALQDKLRNALESAPVKEEVQSQTESIAEPPAEEAPNLFEPQTAKTLLAQAAEVKTQEPVESAPNPVNPISVPAAAAAVSAPAKKGPVVLTVNRKFNFAVVSIGVKDGLQMGDSLHVIRDGQPAGALQVEKLYENFSAATIIKEPSGEPLKEGDSVRRAG